MSSEIFMTLGVVSFGVGVICCVLYKAFREAQGQPRRQQPYTGFDPLSPEDIMERRVRMDINQEIADQKENPARINKNYSKQEEDTKMERILDSENSSEDEEEKVVSGSLA